MQAQHIPGLSLLVAKDGKVIQAEGFGHSNVELEVSAKPETIFQSGSVGKQFTATAVMMLVESGKVGLDDPLTKYFPEAPPTWKEVTVRELLSHTGGSGTIRRILIFAKTGQKTKRSNWSRSCLSLMHLERSGSIATSAI